MSIPNQPLSEQWFESAQVWADLESAASLLEDCKSSVLSQMILRSGTKAHNRAEAEVKASQEWRQHLEAINKARTAANKAKVKLEYLRLKHSEWVNAEANHRQGARL